MLNLKNAVISININPAHLCDGVTVDRIMSLVTYDVRNRELAAAKKKVAALRDMIPDCATWSLETATDADFETAFAGSDLADAKCYRDFAAATRSYRDATGVTADEWRKLSDADRVQIGLLSGTMAADPAWSAGISIDILDKIGRMVADWYSKGTGLKTLAETLSKTAYVVLTRQATLWKPRKLDKLSGSDLRYFVAGFRQAAKWRTVKVRREDGSTAERLVYDYGLLCSNRKAVEKEVVSFIALHLISRADSVALETAAPAAADQAAEKPAEKPAAVKKPAKKQTSAKKAEKPAAPVPAADPAAPAA